MLKIGSPKVESLIRKIYRMPVCDRKYMMPKLRETLTGKKQKPTLLWELNGKAYNG